MNDVKFVPGLYAKEPTDRPDFVKCLISIKREQMIEFLNSRDDEWLNVEVNEAKLGKWYARLNEWKPATSRSNSQPASQSTSPANTFDDDEIPF